MFLKALFSKSVVIKLVMRQTTQNSHRLSPVHLENTVRQCLVVFSATLLLLSTPAALAVAVGDAVPGCTLSPLGDSQTSDLSEYRGKVLYVDFWASWCGSCAKSFSFLNELHQQLKDKGLQVVGVNLDENMEDAKAFLTKLPASFTVMADVSKQCAKDFDVKAMPSSYIIDRKGIIHNIYLGFRPGEAREIRVLVEKLLNGEVAGL